MALAIAVFGNLWLWKVFSSSALLGIILLSATVLLFLAVKRDSKKLVLTFLVFAALLAFFQVRTTEVGDLTYLDNDEQRVQQMRLREYPPVRVSLFGKTLWIPLAHWFEQRKETIAFYRMEENFFEAIDPNLYFFANHPRERIGISEFEKFVYTLIPFFFIGMYRFFKEKRYLLQGALLAFLFLLSYIGLKNDLGPFLLFPFVSLAIYLGLESAIYFLRGKKLMVPASFIFVVIYFLSFLQVLSYAA